VCEALNGSADSDAAAHIRFAVTVYHPGVALDVFHRPPRQEAYRIFRRLLRRLGCGEP